MVPSLYDLDFQDVSRALEAHPRFRVDQLWEGLYRQSRPVDELAVLPLALRSELALNFPPALTSIDSQKTADERTVKRLWQLHDGVTVESVLMHYPQRSTVCISSQAGCAMACGFCATGQAGYDRNLTVGEILEQVARAKREALPRRLSNVVFMGMGEPFANFDRVIEAIGRITTDFGIGARRITVSTVGLVPQINRFADLGLQVGLAISLHAANDELRSDLVPINRRHPIADVVAASRRFREVTGRRVSFEWAMIADTNDRPSDAAELAVVAREARAHVNLIPLNPTPGWPTVGSSTATIVAFRASLDSQGVTVTVRANRGTDIDAACGQLRAVNEATPVALRPRNHQ